jgi:hypothetical protein
MSSPQDDAQNGLAQIKKAILDFLALHPEGASNADVAEALGLKSHFEGEHQGYLSWSLLGLLVNDGRVRYEVQKNRRIYFRV